MVRFEDIREALRSMPEPIDACKSLTERANQAGGHDNITVIVAEFDGDGLTEPAAEGEPLKYRKYSLPEEVPENTERNRRLSAEAPPSQSLPSPYGPGSSMPQGLGSTIVAGQEGYASAPPLGGSGAPSGYQEEQIEIPGTHVPPWVVVVLVVGVMAVLVGTAFVLR
jgi:protein phosphatase